MYTNATKTDAQGNVSFLSTSENIVNVTGAKTLTISDSGIVQVLKAAAGAAIVLPAVTAGKWNFRFKTGLAFTTTAWTITAPTAVVNGGAIVNSVYVACANKSIITLSASAETLGDYVDVICDGTNIYVDGVGALASSIAFS